MQLPRIGSDLGLLAKNRLSDNVGSVKQFSSTLQHALVEERHFALDEAVAFALPTKGSLVIVSGQELGPTHASLRSRTAIMITTSNSS
jgi:hypothetical protein